MRCATRDGLKVHLQGLLGGQFAGFDAVDAKDKLLRIVRMRLLLKIWMFFAYLQSSRRLESERGDLVTSTVADVNVQHVAPAVVQDLDDGDCMFLQSGIVELLHGLVGAIASVIDC